MDPAYRAALEGLAIADGADRAWLEMSGPDAEDFLQRILSSDLRRLEPGAGQWSALLDGDGRWIADLLLYRHAPPSAEVFGMDLPAALAAPFHARLNMLHFSERLTIAAAQPQPARRLLLGPGGARPLQAAGLPVPPDRDGFGLSRAGELTILRRPDRGAPCVEVLGPPARVAAAETAALAGGAVPASAAVLETLRIESFLPRWGADFDGETALPQSNEWRRASVTKGCYAGQEVVARINTYGEAPRQLCRLRFDGAEPMSGADLTDDGGKMLGTVSSWTLSPRSGQGVGLGTLRRKAAAAGARLLARRGDIRVGVTVEVPEKRLG